VEPTVAVVWDEQLSEYDFGHGHPLRPERADLAVEMMRAVGLFDCPRVKLVPARPASDAELVRVHDPDYVRCVAEASMGLGGGAMFWQYGLGTSDDPVFAGMHEAAARVAGATLVGAELIRKGEALHAFVPSGGLHHAMRANASGFCIYDDPAVAIAALLDAGAERVVYVDLDVHHGDGVQAAFYENPRVLTISMHQTGATLFPGTGYVDEIGWGAGRGYAVNLPLWPGTTDRVYLAAFRALVPPLVGAYRPEVIVTQLGCDTHHSDPLAALALTTNAYSVLARELHGLAHRVSEGRWLATGGGGYRWLQVAPRAWTIYAAEMAGLELPAAAPEEFLLRLRERFGQEPPREFLDPPVVPGPEESHALAAAEAALASLRSTVFPVHGLPDAAAPLTLADGERPAPPVR